jgi:hypothetical protein
MSLQTKQIEQMHKLLQVLTVVTLEAHGGCSEATQAVEYQMSVLDEMMIPVEIMLQMIIDLRNLTGEGRMACHKALKRANGDQELAVEYLRR